MVKFEMQEEMNLAVASLREIKKANAAKLALLNNDLIEAWNESPINISENFQVLSSALERFRDVQDILDTDPELTTEVIRELGIIKELIFSNIYTLLLNLNIDANKDGLEIDGKELTSSTHQIKASLVKHSAPLVDFFGAVEKAVLEEGDTEQ